MRLTTRKMKYLLFSPAIIRIIFYHTIVFIKKKIYFCDSRKGKNDSKNSNGLLGNCLYYYWFFALCIFIVDFEQRPN